jgi:hypothetical protein
MCRYRSEWGFEPPIPCGAPRMGVLAIPAHVQVSSGDTCTCAGIAWGYLHMCRYRSEQGQEEEEREKKEKEVMHEFFGNWREGW